jgi:hypothetical protein
MSPGAPVPRHPCMKLPSRSRRHRWRSLAHTRSADGGGIRGCIRTCLDRGVLKTQECTINFFPNIKIYRHLYLEKK